MGFGYTPITASTAAVTNRFVTSVNMANGTYTIANPSATWTGGFRVTITHTSVTGDDTLGTITIVGTGLDGRPLTEVMTPTAGGTSTSNAVFATVTSATQAGWVINVGNDTIVIGHAAGNHVVGSSGILRAIVVNATAAATIVVSDKRGTIATLAASIANGTYYYDVDFSGWLSVATTSTNNVTVIHSGTLPASMAL